jgi:thiamine biosynthesis lipoprotein
MSVAVSHYNFDAIGTQWEITTPALLEPGTRQDIDAVVERFDQTYSRFRDDSVIGQMSKAKHGGRFWFPSEALPMFDLYDRLHVVTDGAVDPLVGGDLERLGYDKTYSLMPSPVAVETSERPRWDRDVERYGIKLETRSPLVIDLGAVGKGSLVDLVSSHLTKSGLENFTVDGGGDMAYRGTEMLRVGLEHPQDRSMLVGVAHLQNASLCASAVNRRRWGTGLHHILDGRTGMPTNDVVATWVVAANATIADGLATALFFVSAARLSEFEFSFVRMFADGRAEVSDNFDGEVFT